MKKKIAEILHITFYIWFGIQICLGIGWAIGNFLEMANFEESKELFSMSVSLCVDEYTGYLYPLIIRVFTGISENTGIPYYSMIYLLQLVLAYFAYEFFLEKVVFHKGWKKIIVRKRLKIYTLFMLTIPPVLQVHMAVLSYSLASSIAIILLTLIITMENDSKSIKMQDIIIMAILWILSSQLCVDYAWISGGIFVIGILRYICINKKVCWKMCITFMVAIMCIAGLNRTLQTPGSAGKIQYSSEGILLTRFVWPKVSQLSYFWDDSVKSQWSVTELLGISTYPEKMIYEFGPVMDKKLGYEEANRVYREMMRYSLSIDSKYVVSSIIKDFGSNICPPLTMYLQMRGRGNSYAGWSYGRMKDYTPRLAYYYANISLAGWIYLVVASGCLLFIGAINKEWRPESERKRVKWSCSISIFVLMFVNMYYVMTSGHMQDYKKVVVISVLWAFAMIAVLNQTEERYRLR